MTKATILYVEDNEGIAYFVTTALTRAGYHGVDSLNVAAASAVAFYQLGKKENGI